MDVEEAKSFRVEASGSSPDLLGVPVEPARIDRLVEIVDHCAAAKDIAEQIGDTFLSYMLSMAIQAARVEMRPKNLYAKKHPAGSGRTA